MQRSAPLLVFLAALLLATWWFWPGSVGQPASAAPTGTSRASDPKAELLAPAHRPEGRSAAEESFDDADLIAALAWLGEVGQVFDPRLEPRSRPVLERPARARRTLELVQSTVLVDDPQTLALSERGAVLALGLAAATYGRAGKDVPAAVRAVDRFEFVSAVIEALPHMRPALAVNLVDLMQRLRLGGRPVVGAAFFQVVLDVRRLHPEQRGVLDTLLEECAAELPGEQRRAIATLFVDETDDATMVKVAFAHLLLGTDGHVYLELAAERLEDTATPAEVRNAILDAVAIAAPVEAAIETLAPNLGLASADVLMQVAAREGGTEALLDAYGQRLAFGGAAEERRWIVVGLEDSAHGEVLLDIARTDPDRDVRGQAMVSFSLDSSEATAEALEAVISGRDQPDDPFVGLDPLAATAAISNLALNAGRAGDGELCEQAVAELVATARSEASPARQRRYALQSLAHHITPGELEALREELGLD
jgi:hypothetical protein